MPDVPTSPDSDDIGRLPDPDWKRLQELLVRFEEAWKAAPADAASVGLAYFLPPPGDPLRRPALLEMIKTELEIRWRRQQRALLEDYLEQFPELGPSLSPQLIHEEFRVRRLYGDRPSLASYRERFPEQFARLEQIAQGITVGPSNPPAAAPPPKPAASGSGPVLPSADAVLPFGGGYRLIERIGQGAFGEVWRARAPGGEHGGPEVAMKIISRPMDHDERKREEEALELVLKFRHPNLVPIQAYWPMADRLAIAMELADGTLRSRLKQCPGGIPAQELLRYFRDTAEALDFLHQHGVQHRDVKPENIMLLQRRAKLADFGLARQQGDHSMTASGSGTPPYMAPEVWQKKVSPRSDQYSLAVAYVELRRGRRPFSGRDMLEMMVDHIERQPDLEPLPEPEQEVLRKALSKDPAQRYASCQEFVEALERAVLITSTALSPALPNGQAPSPNETTLVGPPPPETLTRDPDLPAPKPDGDWRPSTLPSSSLGPWIASGAAVLAAGIVATVAIIYIRNGGKNGKETSPSGQAQPTAAIPTGPAVAREWLPKGSGWRKPEGAVIRLVRGVELPSSIVRDVPGYSKPVVFQLVGWDTNDPQVAPFYMMENKVSHELFGIIASDPRYQELLTTNLPRVANAEHGKWNNKALFANVSAPERNRFPVLDVSVTEAYCFAKWLGEECHLPSVSQWDAAAGCRKKPPERGPYRSSDIEAIADGARAAKDATPLPVDRSRCEVSCYGCRDMAGNGLEWTRTLHEGSREVPLPNPAPNDSVHLRGRSYTKQDITPLECHGQLAEGGEEPYLTAEQDIGFRVIVQVPLPPQ